MFALSKEIIDFHPAYARYLYHKLDSLFQKQKYFCWDFITDQEHLYHCY